MFNRKLFKFSIAQCTLQLITWIVMKISCKLLSNLINGYERFVLLALVLFAHAVINDFCAQTLQVTKLHSIYKKADIFFVMKYLKLFHRQ